MEAIATRAHGAIAAATVGDREESTLLVTQAISLAMASMASILAAVQPSSRRPLSGSLAAIAVAASALLSCVAPADPGAGPGAAAPSVKPGGDFPALPPGDAPPSLGEIAALLARGLPAAERAVAMRLLVDDILARDLRDLPRDPAAQPSAGAIVHAAYATLVRTLSPLAPALRLARLITLACMRRGDRVTRRATALAVARYVADRGRPRTSLVIGYLDEARAYLALPLDGLSAEAARAEQDLAAYELDARGHAACYAQQQPLLADGRHALDAARTGTFDPAAGAFYVFLRNAGERPQHFAPP
ncbi:MAG TPA: hypothetical protein VLM79_31000 [Kofleriaceae bacterium]|nr:hypothetical protein [Kofleriaceae bacterium]